MTAADFNNQNSSSTYDLVEMAKQASEDLKWTKEQFFGYMKESKEKKDWQQVDTTMQPQRPEQLYDEKEAAKMLDISTRKLQQLRKDKEIECTRIGKLVKYTSQQIQDFIDKSKQHNDAA